MSVKIKEVKKGSIAYRAGMRAGDTLLSINGNEIMDVLDYRFHTLDTTLKAELVNSEGKALLKHFEKTRMPI